MVGGREVTVSVIIGCPIIECARGGLQKSHESIRSGDTFQGYGLLLISPQSERSELGGFLFMSRCCKWLL